MSGTEIAANALVALGVVVMTIGVLGLARMPDVYTQLHAASKAVFLGIIAFLAASVIEGDDATVTRSILIAAFLLLTTPISSHMIAKASYVAREPAIADTFDESGLEPGEGESQPSDPDAAPE